jgi:hypothetical protein
MTNVKDDYMKRKIKLTMGNSPCDMRVQIERPNDEEALIG